MSSSLAAQLSQIAASSTSALNLKAQKLAHSKSLIFDPRVAASQSFDSIYTLCHEGFQELCLLDNRFLDFQRSLFSLQSQDQDRTQMTAADNEELNKRLENFLSLVGSRLRLNPAIKAVEWLVRRFRVQEYNTSFLLTTFLPYHTLPIFSALMEILPANIPQAYKFLYPFIRSNTLPARHVIATTVTNHVEFASLLNSYVLRISDSRHHYSALLSFWAGLMTEAVGGMMDKSRSGRSGVQMSNEQEVVLRLLPTLNEGLAMKQVPELRLGCYMLLSVMVSKGGLDDRLLKAMMEAVVLGWTSDTVRPGLACISILAQQRGAKQLNRRITKELIKIPGLPGMLNDLAKTQRVDRLVNGLCLGLIDRLSKNGDATVLTIVEHIVMDELMKDQQTAVVLKALLLAAYRINNDIDAHGIARSALAKCLSALADQTGNIGVIVRRAMDESGIDMDELEMKLKAPIRPKFLQESPADDSMMQVVSKGASPTISNFDPLYAQLQMEFSETFLMEELSPSHLLLLQAFGASLGNLEFSQGFRKTSILMETAEPDKSLYLSFFVRLWCSPNVVLARTAALSIVTENIEKSGEHTVDYQSFIPYILTALGDPAAKVRQAAATLVLRMKLIYSDAENLKDRHRSMKIWGGDEIYGQHSKSLKILPSDTAAQLIADAIAPSLEECILDSNHVNFVLERALNGSRNTTEILKKAETGKLSQSARAAILAFLASHTILTPVYLVKLRLLKALNLVRGVASTSRTKVLLPVLQQWAKFSSSEAQDRCRLEKIDQRDFDAEAVAVVVASDSNALGFLASLVNGEAARDRPALCTAAVQRFQKLWPHIPSDAQVNAAKLFIDTAQGGGPITEAQVECTALLRTVSLSTDILQLFLNSLPTASKLADNPPANKRRRVSHGEAARANLQNSDLLIGSVEKVTFVLQLIENSDPQNHVSLLKSLFNTLVELQHFKTQLGSELAYLQSLVLSSLLAIVDLHKKDKSLNLDRSAVRTDLLVDCVQKTSSPQVQNAALLLIASLAETTPELVLHSVMPIFTYMGSSVLRQNDEYSAHVIKQTINEVIPPLIASLRKEKGNPVTGAAELLSSFVAAYEHVPAHRRKSLYASLVRILGPDEFLYAIIAMLGDKYGATQDIKTFTTELAGAFSVDTQLRTVIKCLDLVNDILRPRPSVSNILLGESVSKSPHLTVLPQLNLLPPLLSQKRLLDHLVKLLERDDMDSARARDLYSTLLEDVLTLADLLKSNKLWHSACGEILEKVLGLLSTSEFVKSVDGLLDRPDKDLRRKILRSLEVRIDQESRSDIVSRQAMLGFLPQLTAIIRESSDVHYKHIALACVDKISEKYGKKDLEAVAAAASTIASEHCLGQTDARLRVMALLCLASLVETLHEGIVSVLPAAIPTALEYLAVSVHEATEDEILHNAGYAFISSLIQYLPYMITSSHLEKLLAISNLSAEAEFDKESDGARTGCLRLAAKVVEAKIMITAMEHNFGSASEAGNLALREYLEVLGVVIEKHPKSTITKNSALLSAIFLKAFDLRRQRASSDAGLEDIDEIEDIINAIAIQMIYKFNDSTFRPIFANVMEWASSGLPRKDSQGRMLRLQSVYSFLAAFFGNLKSIVTSYASYVLENAVDILKNVDPTDEVSCELWNKVLLTLMQCFRHDQDDFWQAPAHFDLIGPAILHSINLPLVENSILAIVELATAADSTDHHKELNMSILKNMRSENAGVRLAAVRCEQALTDRLGEEWLSMLPEMLPFISELQEDDDDVVERETHRWIIKIEGVLGESLDSMLQ